MVYGVCGGDDVCVWCVVYAFMDVMCVCSVVCV